MLETPVGNKGNKIDQHSARIHICQAFHWMNFPEFMICLIWFLLFSTSNTIPCIYPIPESPLHTLITSQHHSYFHYLSALHMSGFRCVFLTTQFKMKMRRQSPPLFKQFHLLKSIHMVDAILFWSIMMNLLRILDWKVGPEHKIFSLGLTLFPGYKVGQLRMVLQANCLNEVDSWFSTPLGYVQWFKQRQGSNDPANMFIYSCNLNVNDKQKGEIIPISTIRRRLQLVPRFSGTD